MPIVTEDDVVADEGWRESGSEEGVKMGDGVRSETIWIRAREVLCPLTNVATCCLAGQYPRSTRVGGLPRSELHRLADT